MQDLRNGHRVMLHAQRNGAPTTRCPCVIPHHIVADGNNDQRWLDRHTLARTGETYLFRNIVRKWRKVRSEHPGQFLCLSVIQPRV